LVTSEKEDEIPSAVLVVEIFSELNVTDEVLVDVPALTLVVCDNKVKLKWFKL
jgi:hypothetical protein